MPSNVDDRVTQALQELNRILGAAAANYFTVRVPGPTTPQYAAFAQRLSVGDAISDAAKRRPARAYALELTVLQNLTDPQILARLQEIQVNRLSQANIEGLVRTAWQLAPDNLARTLGNNALTFMNTYPVVPGNGNADAPAGASAYDLIDMNATGQSLTSTMSLAPIGPNEFAFGLVDAPNPPQPGALPMYFLPWRSQHIVRMTIPAAATSDIFFTAALSGCSVFVEGPGNSPTVYHAGIQLPWVQPTAANCQPAVLQAFGPTSPPPDAPGFWRALFRQHALAPAGAFGEVNKTHYVSDGTMTATAPPRRTTAAANAFEQSIRGTWPARGITVNDCIPWGCVFGVRTAGAWAFYLQENVTVVFARGGANWRTARLMRVTRFFPTPALAPVIPAGYLDPPPVGASPTVFRA